MLRKPPPERSRRVVAIYFITTVVGGAILIFFIASLWLLYWMKAKVPLREAHALVPPDAVAYAVADFPAGAPRPLGPDARAVLLQDAPSSVARLIEKGLDDPTCPVRVVAALTPYDSATHASLAVALGKYPGMFRVVRRDLQVRAKEGSLPAAFSFHAGQLILELPGAACPVWSLPDCTILRGSDRKPVADVLDRTWTQHPAPVSYKPLPIPPGLSLSGAPSVRLYGWSERYPAIPFDLFPPELEARLRDLETDLMERLPPLAQASFVFFSAQPSDSQWKALVSFGLPTDAEARLVAEALPVWLAERAGLQGVSVEHDATGVRVAFTLP